MKWAVVAVAVAVAAVIAVNAMLLLLGGDRHDPVGRLSPVTSVPTQQTPIVAGERDDD